MAGDGVFIRMHAYPLAEHLWQLVRVYRGYMRDIDQEGYEPRQIALAQEMADTAREEWGGTDAEWNEEMQLQDDLDNTNPLFEEEEENFREEEEYMWGGNLYNTIVNPQTGRKVSIYGKTGKKILSKYLN